MSKSEIKSTLKQELTKVNKVIDHKILKGMPYSHEARYHKLLLGRLSVLNQSSFIARMKTVSTFLF